MGTVFAIFVGLFGLAGVYTAVIGTNDYGGIQRISLLLV